MKTGMKKGSLTLAVWMALWLMLASCAPASSQSAGSGETPAVPEASECAGLTNLSAMLEYHDTVVVARLEENGKAYHGEGDRSESWYVDTTYTVKETLRGDLQVGDTVTVQEPVTSETATPYSRKVQADGPEGTLLFLQKEGNGYHISTPKLSMQPLLEWYGKYQIQWLDGVKKTTIEGTDVSIRSRRDNNGIADTADVLASRKDALAVSVDTVPDLYREILREDATAADCLTDSERVVRAAVEERGDLYEKDGRWYQDLTFRVKETAKGEEDGDRLTLTIETGTDLWQPITDETEGYDWILLLKKEGDTWQLWHSSHDSLSYIDEWESIYWFQSSFPRSVTGNLRTWEDVFQYCQEGENK